VLKKLKNSVKALYRSLNGLSNGAPDIQRLLTDIIRSRPNHDSPIFFVQIGAGPGDLDSGAGFRDGFTGVIKSLPLTASEAVLLVEPNPFNIDNLQKCWSNFDQARIFEVAVVPKKFAGETLDFFYTGLDAPHFNVASINPQHVLKHYKSLNHADLQVLRIPTTDLASFLETHTKGALIGLLALDIEGIDAEILLETDFSRMNVCLISFERIHLGDSARAVSNHLRQCGFEYFGIGVDHNGLDDLYRRVNSGSQ
jgi:hypothetical protein